VTLQGDGFPRCSVATIQQFGVEACDAASQVGSGAIRDRVGPAGAPIELRAYVPNGSAPGTVIIYLDQPNGGLDIAFEGQVMPSDDDAYGSRLVVPIPVELQRPGGLYMSITDIDILLHANAGAPYAAIAACPPNSPGFKTVVSFNPTSPGAPADPLSSTAAATCTAAPPPPVNPIPRPAPPPAPPAPPAPPPPAPESSERAVAAFGVRLQRKDGKVRGLHLTGMSRGTRVSVRCLQRCGRRGAELRKSVRDGKVGLKRPLRPRSRFEVRLSQTGLVTRFARYRVDRRARTAIRTQAGCLGDRGAQRACPAAR
jgi:hypothetical protein